MNLPANTSHMKMPQPPDLTWTIPMTGWLLAYHAKLVDAAGNSVPGVVLHHVAFWNENRSDFLCPQQGRTHFRSRWRTHRLDANPRLRLPRGEGRPDPRGNHDSQSNRHILPKGLSGNFHSLPRRRGPRPRQEFLSAWMDVASCGNSSYDLPAGPSKKSWLGSGKIFRHIARGRRPHACTTTLNNSRWKFPASHAPRLKCRRRKLHERNLRSQANRSPFYPQGDDQGHLLSIPVVTFFPDRRLPDRCRQ